MLSIVKRYYSQKRYREHLPRRHDQKTHGRRFKVYSASEVTSVFGEITRKLIREFPRSTIDSLTHYSREGVGPSINNYLRGRATYVSDRKLEAIDDLDWVISKSELPEDVKTFRGVGVEEGSSHYEYYADPDKAVGKIISDEGFVSTSFIEEKCKEFFRERSQGVLFELEIPKGHNGLYMAPVSVWPAEKELLLPAGTQFKITEYLGSGEHYGVKYRRFKARVLD